MEYHIARVPVCWWDLYSEYTLYMGFLERIVGVLSPLYLYYRNGGETCHWNWDDKIPLMTIFRNLMDRAATQGIGIAA